MKWIKYALIIVGSALVLTVAVFIGLFFWYCWHPYIEQSNGPVSRDKALQHSSMPLPLSAHNVQYASSALWQNGESYVRFEAPVADCYALAKTIFTDHAKENSRYVIPKFQPVSHPEREKSHDLRIDWFDIDQISKGVVAGTGWGWEPKVWIDEERGIFYCEVHD